MYLRNFLKLAALLVLAAYLLMACGSSSSSDAISGVWEVEDHREISCNIVFQGNVFSVSAYQYLNDTNRQSTHSSMRDWARNRWDLESENVTDTYDLSRIAATVHRVTRHTVSGTFYINDNRTHIELTGPNGRRMVYNFMETENTITIGHQRFYRR